MRFNSFVILLGRFPWFGVKLNLKITKINDGVKGHLM